MNTIKQSYKIEASVEKVWDGLINPKTIVAWGGGPAKMSDEEGFAFKLWGGDIHGTNTKVIENKELRQDWYGGDWKKPSKVVFKLMKSGYDTKVDLTHIAVPEGEIKNISDGWKEYYLGPLKKYLEKD